MKQSSRRTFVAAVVLALIVIPVSAIAVFLASGVGTVSGAQVTSTSPSSIVISAQYADPASEFSYSGPSTTALAPGGQVRFGLNATCLTSCPASVGSIRLVSVSSDKAGCSSAALPGTFASSGLAVNTTVDTTTQFIGGMVVAMSSTGDDQSPCLSATLTFHLATP